MTKSKSKPGTTSEQSQQKIKPWRLAVLLLGLGVTVLAFIVMADATLRILCLATAAWLVWLLLRATGRL